ncbi:MAG: DUF1361 domain-containing protein [Patescibacteria group bacterium]
MNISSQSFNKFFHSDFWPESLFINDYPALVMVWNLLLLAIPFYLFMFLYKYWRVNKFKRHSQKIVAVMLGFLWLLFIPNTAYLITDIRHLINYCPLEFSNAICPEGAWMIMLFFTYSSIGWVAFVILLNQMKEFIERIWGKKISNIFIWLLIPLISLGVLIGLVDRWNSWDFFLHPILIFKSLLMYVNNVIYFRNWVVFTIGLYILYHGGDWLFSRKINR